MKIYNIAIVHHKNNILLHKKVDSNQWTVPTSQHLQPESSLKESVINLIRESSGLETKIEKIILVRDLVEDSELNLEMYWLLKPLSDEFEISPFEHNGNELNWFSKEEAKDKLYTGDIEMSQEFWSTLSESLYDSTSELKENLSELERRNIELKETKEAMRVLLNDEELLEKELKEERDRAQLIIESMGEGLLVIDERKNIVLINPEAERMLEINKNDVLGKEWSDLVVTMKGKTETPVEERSFSKVLTEAKTIVTELEDDHYYKTKSGKIFPIVSITAPLVADGKLFGAVKVFRDVTKDKDVDRMKTEFISLASHQLRTPLSAMKWFLEMLLAGDAGELNPEQKEYVKNVDDSNERMIELVNSLLNISRIESGRIIVDPEPTDLKELAQSVIDELKQKFEIKKQTPIVSIHGDLPLINLDSKLIRNVFMNLLTNANKYTPEGGTINIFISRKENMIVSQVSDSGYGIPDRDKDKIFEKFFRSENIVKKETEGSGLGLYLVKAIIESSDGEIWFDSKEGEGTTFWFSLPIEGMKKKEGEVSLS